jgi:hypothetical protein
MAQHETTPSDKQITDGEINHRILDMPDMGNSSLLLLGSQAIAEGVTGQPAINSIVLGALATGLFFTGLISESKGIELARQRDQKQLTPESTTVSVSIIDRLRGVGYALIASGAVNEVVGVVHGDIRRIAVGIAVATTGIAATMIGVHLRPEPTVAE